MPFDSAAPANSTTECHHCQAPVVKEVRKWDRVGSWLSALCALHCLLTPFITLSLPFWLYSIHYSPVHLVLALFVIPIGVYTFWQGYQRHGRKSVVIFGLMGLALLSVGLVSPSSREQLRWNDILTVTGSFLLIAAHTLNRWNLHKH